MARWEWLNKPEKAYGWGFVARVAFKTGLLFIVINLLYALLEPLPLFSRLTLYNTVLPGRERLPYSDNPADTYNLSLHRIEGMFASHILSSADKPTDEFRVVLLGDSMVWGWLLETDETFNACLNAGNYRSADGRRLRVYNLGYPVTTVLKDALLLEEAARYEIDAAVWFVTLQALYRDEQLRHPILQNNSDRARAYVEKHDLALDTSVLPDEPDFWDRTLVGQRRELADLLRHQVYGLAWLVTGIDHTNPRFFRAPPSNLLPGIDIPTRAEIQPPLTLEWLALDVIDVAMRMAQKEGIEVLLVNEPIFITEGLNRENRYNDLYPRWAYDDYRRLLGEQVTQNGWAYIELWDAVPSYKFTDYPLHFTADETCRLAHQLAPEILRLAE